MRWLKSKQIIGSRCEGMTKNEMDLKMYFFCLFHLDVDLQKIRILLMISIACVFKNKKGKNKAKAKTKRRKTRKT